MSRKSKSRLRALARGLRSRVSGGLLRLKTPSRWAALDDGALSRRHYRSYDAYLRHQRAKLERIDLTNYDREYRRVLRDRLRQLDGLGSGTAVLCLAARIGTEVKAFTDLGCFAVGIDLNPGGANPYVLYGDFHALQFADGSVDVVFTNSLDHCFEIDRVLAEVQRVLRPDGRFVIEAVRGVREGCAPLFYESFSWATIDDLVRVIAAKGFVAVARHAFDYPWLGEQICFRSGVPDTGVGRA